MFQNLSKSRKEMEELSAALESLINGEEPALDRISEDNLPSKIRSQILRLNDKMRGSEQALLKEREEIRGLIADTAHQLRTPLANMESYLSLLKADLERKTDETESAVAKLESDGAADGDSESICMEDQAYYIRAIAESEEKIRFLTEGFIRMARLENGIIQIRKDSLDMEGTLLGSILQAKKAADEKQIEICLTMNGESGRTKKTSGREKGKKAGSAVLHDPQWLGEAVFNLLDNSIKYSPVRSTIHVSTVKNEMFFRIEVRDEGAGIEEGEENLIFRRFYRGKRVNGQNGFGLGLYLSREIVQRHGGFMKVKRLEPGLSVGIYLPVE
ncbi:sensor histidine kinase [Mediterraneibacter glycyrrhizinilyticus]|nr:ATP-binding protein [Mediterraneibacter glycyrrhizinilyticus]MBM6853725.1 sensor histidine kinase [Mediterraneibacter glycyrrhizinilyticus]